MCCCSLGFAKFVLIFINGVFFIVGTLIFVLGIMAKFHQDTLLEMFMPEQLMEDINSAWDMPNLLAEAAVMLIIVGAFILVVGFLGCCGAIKEVKCMLGTYIAIVGLILVLQLTIVIIVIVKTQGANETITSLLQESIRKNYQDSNGGLSFDDEGNLRFAIRPVKLAWDGIQVVLSCCGAVNATDYVAAKFSGNYNFTTNTSSGEEVFKITNAKIPLSCCTFVNKDEYETGREEITDEKTQLSMPSTRLKTARNAQTMVSGCLSDMDPKYIHSDGCYKTFLQLIEAYWSIFVGIIIGTMVVEAIGITCAATVLRRRAEKGKPI